jgi:lysozyme
MESLKKYNNFIYEKQIDKLIFDLSNVNEYHNQNSKIKITVTNKKDAKTLLDIALDKIDTVKDNIRDSYIKYIMAAVIGYLPMNYIVHQFDKKEVKINHTKPKKKNNYKDVQKLNLSKNGLSLIKKHETLKLYAYSIGDGKITIGYGTAYDINNSPYKVGDEITKEKAIELLKKRVTIAENGVKRIFKEWDDENNPVHISQNQFDALVSMAYNMGVRGLRNTRVMELIKNKQFKEAGEIIKKTKVSKKFKGLYTRREEESDLFLYGHDTAFYKEKEVKS